MFGKKKKNRENAAAPAADEQVLSLAELRTRLPFTDVEGSDSGKDPVILALTTCGFCKKAMQFLNEGQVAYSYLYADKLKPEEKKLIRAYVSSAFHTSVTYPFLIMNGKKWISGFLRVEWEGYFPHE